MSNQVTKKQHYVPQFILRGFDTEASNVPKVHIFDVKRSSFRDNQTIKDVFQQNYFYDKNNKIENFICEHIETPAAQIINAIRARDTSALSDSDHYLIKFMCCQHERTVEAKDDALNFLNAQMGLIFQDYARLNELDTDIAKGIRIEPKGKDSMRDFIAAQALDGVLNSKGMEDLKFHLLRNTTSKKFILSDHPVSRYNWYYKEFEHHEIGSLMAKGVQLFLPISKDLCVCVYDPKIYKYGPSKLNVSEVNDVHDIDWLNQLQMRSASSFVAFSSMSSKSEIFDLNQRYSGKKIYERKGQHLCQQEVEGGKVKTTHMVYTTQVNLSQKPTFFKVLKKAKANQAYFTERNPEVSGALMLLKKHVREQRTNNQALTSTCT